MKVLLFRHAETAWTLTGQHTGRTDLALTDRGRAQARAASVVFARLLSEQSLDAVYSSPRRRALETLELALPSACQPVLTPLLAEVDYGDYEGLTPAEIRVRDPGWSVWKDGGPGGETFAQAEQRADAFIGLLAGHPRGAVCAVSHGHMIRILAARLLNLEGWRGRLFSIKTASVAELVRTGDEFVLSSWNVTA